MGVRPFGELHTSERTDKSTAFSFLITTKKGCHYKPGRTTCAKARRRCISASAYRSGHHKWFDGAYNDTHELTNEPMTNNPMTQPHRFTLQPYTGIKSRFKCPECQHRNKTFTRYIDTETGKTLADHVGRCDRENNCGYHYTPSEFFKANPYAIPVPLTRKYDGRPAKLPFSVLPFSLAKDSMRAYGHNNFVCFLNTMFGEEKAAALVKLYHIGTANHWPGATIFWQIDIKGKVRTGKIMLYNKNTCKRVKHPFNYIAWVHNLSGKAGPWKDRLTINRQMNYENYHRLNDERFVMEQCLFGEHLLYADAGKLVCLVESEKTAIIAAAYYPDYIWLAAGSLNGLNPDKCQALKNRSVMLFPDVNSYGKWYEKAMELNARIPSSTFKVSNALENNATEIERLNGIDIADRWIDDFLEEWND